MQPPDAVEPGDVGALDSISDTELCEDCEEIVSDFFCNVCQCHLCRDCWDRQPAHRKKRLAPGQIPHEKTELRLVNRLQTVFSYAGDEKTLDRLHKDDEVTAWFGLEREREDGRPFMFRDHGRFADLATSSHHSLFKQRKQPGIKGDDQNASCIPSLVSFVGQTGAGKSTLIKLLVQFNQWSGQVQNFPSPVPGIAGRDLPTSEDVHLYADPLTAGSEFPILYADSEGLDGGEREPLAASLRKTREKRESDSFGSESDYLPSKNYTEREVQWMTSKLKRTREYAVGQLYPRVLFAFSDVVVFVHRNPRAIEGVLERLLEWGSVAIETTYNQPILPYAILALNATESDVESQLWDVEMSTKSLLESLANTVNKNVKFSSYAELWRKRGKKVDTVEDLMLCYYSALRVIRLPTNGRPKLLDAQAQKLYFEIERGCRLGRNVKAQTRMLLNAFEFQAYLNHAFDHFCTTIDVPFDFVQCSYLNRRLSSTFGESILSLAVEMSKKKPRPKATKILEKLERLIASCIMLDAVRNEIKGTAERIIAQYIPQVDAALEEFGDHHWPCEFYVKGPIPPHLQAYMDNMSFQQSVRAAAVIMRCANVRSGHAAKGHQLTDGRVFARGSYESSFSFERDRKQVLDNVYIWFRLFMDKLAHMTRQGHSLLESASTIHRDDALASHYLPIDEDGIVQPHLPQRNTEAVGLRYTSFCICCLFGTPEALLPCGHMVCRDCILAYSVAKGVSVVDVECPIRIDHRRRSLTRSVYLRSDTMGVRVLALANGGIRSIIQVEILKLIEAELGGKLPIQSFFDMIIGEGTGGVIALGLVTSGWSLADCETHVMSLVEKIFTRGNTQRLPNVSLRPTKSSHAKYRSKILDESLNALFQSEPRIIDTPPTIDPIAQSTRLAVLTSSATGRKVLFSNYRRRQSPQLPYTLYPVVDYTAEPRIWEIARAAMAHTDLFKHYTDPRLGPLFFQKDMSEGFLIEVAQSECQAVYTGIQKDFPDVLLSLGCGRTYPNPTPSIASLDSKKTKASRWTRKTRDDATSIFTDYSWENHEHYTRPNFISLNPVLEVLPELDDVSAIPELQTLIREATDLSIIKKLASQLFATLFFAETDDPVQDTPAGEALIPVRVRCRLLDGSSPVRETGAALKNGPFRHAEFVFWEDGYASQQFPIPSRTLEKMIQEKIFPVLNLLVPVFNPETLIHGILRLENNEEYPLSGFPRFLNMSRKGAGKSSEAETSHKQQRSPWMPPDMQNLPATAWSMEPLRAWLDASTPQADHASPMDNTNVSLFGEPSPLEDLDTLPPAYEEAR
ncbi:hypothetical protein EJ04DRAFT_503032 [Polyplosphaeria fusca]|uniref:Uncharacterized protein n=1 Tax=Polyplosphaeria fusca TaxID=682080 RepID=A0A9P4QQF1_9PLEO|nr:hypothetical protein EJ04DRAFT_503032 [Polyplosphaeria fusca]